jgi:membrane protease subunit HflK
MLASLIQRLGVKLNLNDPRWGHKPEGDHKAQEGKKPGEGPPDLDQMWRDFNARLNRMFGQKNGGGGNDGGPYRPDMRGAGATAGVVVAVIALIWLASGSFIVQEGQQAVVTTFGKKSGIVGAGFNWRWPTPFQAHEIVNVSTVRTAEIGYRGTVKNKKPQESLMLTEDLRIVDIQFAVQYTIKDPAAWLFNNRDTDETIRQVAETAIREVVGHSQIDFVLYQGREKVGNDVNTLMQQIINRYDLGAQVTNVTMQAVQPPEQVQSAFDDFNKAEQDIARLRSEGEAYANDIVPKAKGDALALQQEAQGHKARVVQMATGDASRFSQVLVEYQKAPAVTRDRMYLEAMQQIFTSATKVMVDAKSGSNLLYLPLDKLIAQTAANDAAVGAKSGPVAMPAPALTPDMVQGLEQLRQRETRARETSRDREGR